MAITASTFDQARPARIGNSGFGMLTGTFTDPAQSYAAALALISGRFQTSPPPRIVYVLTGVANVYAFQAFGRVV